MSEPIHYAERNAHQCWTCKNRVGQVKHTVSVANTDGIPSKLGVLLPECGVTGSGMWWVNECPCPDYICAYEVQNKKGDNNQMAEENTSRTCERFDGEPIYNCGSCKYERTSLIKEPCMSCHIDHEQADKKPTKYEPKSCDCETCKINV